MPWLNAVVFHYSSFSSLLSICCSGVIIKTTAYQCKVNVYKNWTKLSRQVIRYQTKLSPFIRKIQLSFVDSTHLWSQLDIRLFSITLVCAEVILFCDQKWLLRFKVPEYCRSLWPWDSTLNHSVRTVPLTLSLPNWSVLVFTAQFWE